MSNLLIGTNVVFMDEPCYFLAEIDEQSPGSRGFHRYQSLTVIRAGQKTVFQRDLGESKRFTVDPFQIVGGATDPVTGRIYIEETVGSLIDMANHLREGPYERPEPPPVSDLIGAYFDQEDRKRKARQSLCFTRTKHSGFGGWAISTGRAHRANQGAVAGQDSLIDMANHLREGPYERPEPPPVSDLIGAYFDQEDRKRKARQSLSTFGYGQALQRS